MRTPRLLLAASLLASAVQALTPVPCPEGERPAEDRFEPLRTIQSFAEGQGTWTCFEGGQQAQAQANLEPNAGPDGTQALRVDVTFGGEKDLEYLELGPDDVTFEDLNGTLGLRVRREGAPVSFRIHLIDPSGETHQINLPPYKGPGWEFLTVPLRAKGGIWGGDGNKTLDLPCRLHSIVGDRPHKDFQGTATIWLQDVGLFAERKPKTTLRVAIDSFAQGNLYEPDTRITVHCEADAGTIVWDVTAFPDRVLNGGSTPAGQVNIPIHLAQTGHYACRMSLILDGREEDVRVFRCAALPPPTPEQRNDFVGFCCHFQRPTAWPIEGMDLFARYGFTEFRDEIPWSSVELEKDVLTMPEDRARFTHRAVELGLHPLLIFCYGNPHHSDGGFPNDPETIAAYSRYCRFLAEHLRDHVDSFEVWNEWTVKCGMGGKPGSNSPAYYADMLKTAVPGVRAAHPVVHIVGLGGEHSGHHVDNIRGMLENGIGPHVDACSVHSYRYPRTPEETDLYEEIRAVADMVEEHQAPPRIWVTEIGWPTHRGPRGVDEDTQARHLVRTMALLQATGVVERVHWYDFKNDGLDLHYNENNFGVVLHQHFNYAPKPAAVAAAVFARLTAGASCGELQRDTVWSVPYTRPDGSVLTVLWTPETSHPLPPPQTNGTVLLDIMGNPVPPRAEIAASPTPLYRITPTPAP